ncbi:MAG: hypothetical protein WBX26_05755 [Candidatus Cybelea sp.]
MQISNLAKYAAGVSVAAALLAGCSSGGTSALRPSTGTQNAVRSGHLQPLKVGGLLVASAMLPAVKPIQVPIVPDNRKKNPKEYISNFYSGVVLQFDFPKSDVSTATISGVSDPQGECAQNGNKAFWVVAAGSDEIEEFAYRGSSPVVTLSESAGEPASCTIDAKTEDMAVTILGAGDVVIFTDTKGTGTTVADGLASSYFPTYDNKGDLFVDGVTQSDTYGVVEMASGKSSFKAVTLPNTIEFPGGMQWDGTYVTLNDQSGHAIYQYSISGDVATLKGTVSLSGSSDCVQTWIAKKVVYCPDAGNEDTEVYAYPAGGSPIATLSGSFDLPIGAVSITNVLR